MQIIRTIVWVVVAVVLLVFSINNWKPVEIKIWEDLVLETKIPALVIVSFLIGLLPIWLIHQSSRWRFKRRIKSLETAVRSATGVPPQPTEESTLPVSEISDISPQPRIDEDK